MPFSPPNSIHTARTASHENADYINANFISTCQNEALFIATQGPLKTTITHFWTMVSEQSVSLVVMLTQLREHEKHKCDQYWPTEVGATAHGVTLLAVEQVMTNLIKRSI